jgi:hypothetical protein
MSEDRLRKDTLTKAIAPTSGGLNFTITETMSLTEVAKTFALSGLFKDLTDKRAEEGATAQREAMIKILAGREMGMEPVESMMGLVLVEGRISMSADTMAGRIAGHSEYRHRVREITHAACEIEFEERQDNGGWISIGKSKFSIEDAQAAGLCKVVDGRAVARSRNGNALPWESYTRNMLFARAMSNGFRWFVPHLKLARVYTSEEVQDMTAGGLHVPGESPTSTAGDVPLTDLDAALDATDADFTDVGDEDAEGAEGNEGADPTEPDGSETPPESAPTDEPDSADPTQAESPESSQAESESSDSTDTPPKSSAEGPETAPEPAEPSEPVDPQPPPPAQENEPGPSPQQIYSDWLKGAAQVKKALGSDENTYRTILAKYCAPGAPAKSNGVPPADTADCLAELRAALTSQSGPSTEAMAQVADLKKPEVLSGIRSLEVDVLALTDAQTAEVRLKHGVSGKLDKVGVDVLRVYLAHLSDRMNDTQSNMGGPDPEVQV